jgi:hypothetical protein
MELTLCGLKPRQGRSLKTCMGCRAVGLGTPGRITNARPRLGKDGTLEISHAAQPQGVARTVEWRRRPKVRKVGPASGLLENISASESPHRSVQGFSGNAFEGDFPRRSRTCEFIRMGTVPCWQVSDLVGFMRASKARVSRLILASDI